MDVAALLIFSWQDLYSERVSAVWFYFWRLLVHVVFSSFMYTMLGGWDGAFGRALTFLTWPAHNWEEWYAPWQSLPCTCRIIFIQEAFLVFLVAQFSYYPCYFYWVLKIDIDHLVGSGNIVGSKHSDKYYRLEWPILFDEKLYQTTSLTSIIPRGDAWG